MGTGLLEENSSVRAKRLDIMKQMEPFAEEKLLLLKPPGKCWQPTEFLPEATSENWHDEVRALRETAKPLSDELLVVLIGDMVTEEALPSYQTMLTATDGFLEGLGTSMNPWGRWARGWTAEENRHGDLLNRYLYLTGRVDMRSVEETVQYLISNGWDPMTARDPYKLFVYTSFQERATKVSHGNVGRIAEKEGDSTLARICTTIAADEAKHESAYKLFFGECLRLDPNGSMVAFREMLETKITMPSRYMEDGQTENLYDVFSIVAQRMKVYTSKDYADILQHLVEYWDIPNVSGLSGEGKEAQDYVCDMARRYARLAERAQTRLSKNVPVKFPWIFNRAV
jgi:acyl-[acyl-carrier-protein] desaturase